MRRIRRPHDSDFAISGLREDELAGATREQEAITTVSGWCFICPPGDGAKAKKAPGAVREAPGNLVWRRDCRPTLHVYLTSTEKAVTPVQRWKYTRRANSDQAVAALPARLRFAL